MISVQVISREQKWVNFGERRGFAVTGTGSRFRIRTTSGVETRTCEYSQINTEYRLVDSSLLGVEFHWFKPFVTIKNRVQIGVNLGGGAAWARGSVEEQSITTAWTTFNGDMVLPPTEVSRTEETVTADKVFKEMFRNSTVPTGRIEAVVGIIATDHLKIKLGGGLNFPGTNKFSVGVAYLIGAQ